MARLPQMGIQPQQPPPQQTINDADNTGQSGGDPWSQSQPSNRADAVAAAAAPIANQGQTSDNTWNTSDNKWKWDWKTTNGKTTKTTHGARKHGGHVMTTIETDHIYPIWIFQPLTDRKKTMRLTSTTC